MGEYFGRPVTRYAAVQALCRFKNPGSNIETAIGLSFAKKNQNDIRPDLLAWFWGMDDSRLEIVLNIAARAILEHAAFTGVEIDIDVLASAAADSAARARRKNRQRDALVPIETRAKQLKIRREVYADLVCAGETILMNGITEGMRNYLAVCGYADVVTIFDFGRRHERTTVTNVAPRIRKPSRRAAMPRAA